MILPLPPILCNGFYNEADTLSPLQYWYLHIQGEAYIHTKVGIMLPILGYINNGDKKGLVNIKLVKPIDI